MNFRFFIIFLLSGCAQLHSIQIGERNLNGGQTESFEVMTNETGFDLAEAGAIMKAVSADRTAINQAGGTMQQIWTYISFGPKTGKPVTNDKYADSIGKASQIKCSPKKTTGITIIRETNHYPVISGEIVKVTGGCLR